MGEEAAWVEGGKGGLTEFIIAEGVYDRDSVDRQLLSRDFEESI